MIGTPFSDILKRAIDATPGAIGGAFAASDGETVDSVSRIDDAEWAIYTAHYGIVLKHVQAALNTFHYGEAHLLIVRHERIELLLRAVSQGYFAMLAVEPPAALGSAMRALDIASDALRKEMH